MKKSEKVIIEAVKSGEFSIDSEGRIWRYAKWINYRVGYRRLTNPIRGERSNIGYLEVSYSKNEKSYRAKSHRIVWIYFHNSISNDKQINHKNGVRSDNRPCNLELVTSAENVQHAYRTGLAKGRPGTRHHMVKLSKKDVYKIRSMYNTNKYSQEHLGKLFGISQTHVGRIIRHKRWQCLDH